MEHPCVAQVSSATFNLCVMRWVIHAKTSFSHYLKCCMHVARSQYSVLNDHWRRARAPRGGSWIDLFVPELVGLRSAPGVSASRGREAELFPLPLPIIGVSKRGDGLEVSGSLGAASKGTTAGKGQLLFVLVVMLNYLFEHRPRSPSYRLLRRRAFSGAHLHIFATLGGLIDSWSRRAGEGILLRGGRRGPALFDLLTRLEGDLLGSGRTGFSRSSATTCDSPHQALLHDSSSPTSSGAAPAASAVPVALARRDYLPQTAFARLDPERLVFKGPYAHWDMGSQLGASSLMPFLEPLLLRRLDPKPRSWKWPGRNLDRDAALKLYARLAAVNLLGFCWGELPDWLVSSAFNTYKDPSCDRFILDRRGPNGAEGIVPNVHSARLPAGWLLTGLVVSRFFESLRLYTMDRSDCYLQALVSLSRTASNAMGLSLTPAQAKALAPEVYEAYKAARGLDGRGAREVAGDKLGCAVPSGTPVDVVHACFGSLPPGDHAAVEWVQEAHGNELSSVGLLAETDRLMNQALIPQRLVVEGLCIDDYFMLARCGTSGALAVSPGLALARLRCQTAKDRYDGIGLYGAPHKDQFEVSEGTVIGAELLAGPGWTRRGLVCVSAPLERRLPLAVCNLRAACLPCLTPGFVRVLAGSNTSQLMYRRPLMVVQKEIHAFAASSPEHPHKLSELPRAVADDLVLSALSLILAVTDLTAEIPNKVWALDASPSHGAITVAEVSAPVAEAAWLGSDRIGGYSRLDSASLQLAKSLGLDTDVIEEFDFSPQGVHGAASTGDGAAVYLGDPPRELAMFYDFVEVCGGASKVTQYVAKHGAICAPVLDLSLSKHYDLGQSRFVEWVLWLIWEHRVLVVAVEPPCTSFSVACNSPPLRSRERPRGLDPDHPKVFHGNRLMFMALLLLLAVDLAGISGFGEQPRTSRALFLQEWLFLVARTAFSEVWTATCGHRKPLDSDPCIKKEFVFLCCRMTDFKVLVHRPCPGGHPHVPVCAPRRSPGAPKIKAFGAKGSAVYSDRLAAALATSTLRTVRARRESLGVHEGLRSGPERLHINELLLSGRFEEVRRWAWRKPGHINMLESAVIRSWLLGLLGGEGCRYRGALRPPAIVDSRAAGLSLAKGRSSSDALNGSLEQLCVVQVVGALYPGVSFGPSKLNVADDPTRFRPVRPLARPPPLWAADGRVLRWLASLPPLNRVYAAWARLVLAAGRCGLAGASASRLRALALGVDEEA